MTPGHYITDIGWLVVFYLAARVAVFYYECWVDR
jgi:hypothetical protein